MTDDGGERPGGDGMTYAGAGVDIDASEAATAALVSALGDDAMGGYAGLLDLGDRYLGLTTDGVGTKILVAAALGDYSTVGIDCIAMNANDLVAAGVEPLGFVDYLAVEEPDDETAEAIGRGLSTGASLAGVDLLGGETAVMPEVVEGLDLAGACVGVAPEGALFDTGARAGDALVGFPSSGIHSNGLTLARKAITGRHDYVDPFPPDDSRTVGEVLLEPTRVYTDLLGPLREAGIHACAHVTGGGWMNILRMGEMRYVVADPFDPQPVFTFVQREGNVDDREMHRTFNMGTGFVAACPPETADGLVAGTDGRRIGRVESTDGGESAVDVRGLTLSA
jgi:phosphoribosylformylglycinamidine cyclo-ligase